MERSMSPQAAPPRTVLVTGVSRELSRRYARGLAALGEAGGVRRVIGLDAVPNINYQKI